MRNSSVPPSSDSVNCASRDVTEALVEASLLVDLWHDTATEIMTDASDFAVGAVL